ncbi:MAG: YcxB family protein [Bacteroidetes bacterium]|nr:MAG: YcxB family protein [Bacteroidota bacterium]
MIAKTRKYELDKKLYRRICLNGVMKQRWWIPVAIFVGIIVLNILLNFAYRNTWIYFFAPIGAFLYYGFWWVQFTGAPHLPQMKDWFKKYMYEISSQHILMKEKENSPQGMQIKWENIKSAEKQKDGFVLYMSVAQFIYLPFKIFQNDTDLKFTESVLRRKNLLKEEKTK